jgi:multiple sugar transport system ATP-binding protein
VKEARLKLDGVAKIYPGQVALQPLNLSVAPGQFTVLLGPSGSGKTTTLRLMAGLEKPSLGRVFIDGGDVTHLPPGLRDIAFAFQLYALYPHLNVLENVAFPLRAQGFSASDSRKRALRMLERVGLEGLARFRPQQLSGGEQQLASLARTLVRSPKAYLMDEPLGNLDGAKRLEMRETLRVLHNERESTTVLVTHDQGEAMAVADQIVILRDGRVVQAASPRQVYEFPINLFVAHFVGSPGMNVLRGHRKGEFVTLEALDRRIRVAELGTAVTRRMTGETPCYMGVRPEHVLLSEEGALCGALRTEALGTHNILELESNRQRLKVWLPPGIRVPTGDQVGITFIPSGCRWFHGETGDALPWRAWEVS